MDTTNNGRGFPDDLAREILLRSPVKSLLRFKCSCKNWSALINHPSFIKQHLNCSNNNKKEPQLLIYDYGTRDDDSSPITLINSDGTAAENPVNYFQRFRGMTHLIGSVDGLFLLERETDGNTISVALWNPATRELRPLPVAQFNCGEPQLRKYFGFGLDPLTNDYKVVCFNCFFDDETLVTTEEMCVYAAVYSCSRDSWRIFSPNNYKINYARCCFDARSTAYLNGAYYWRLEPFPTATLLSFDFSNEVFGEIKGPYGCYWAELILFGDSIALLNPTDRSEFEIWVMIQPGVWNKLLTYECFTHFVSWYSNTAILATKRSRLVTYNVRTKETRHLGFCHRGLRRFRGGCLVHCYRESLVSIERRRNGELNHSSQA